MVPTVAGEAVSADATPDHTAVRTALWRALHLEIDPPPHVFDDAIGLRIAAPGKTWRKRPDMNPKATRIPRAAIVARARFIEDLVKERSAACVAQYVILGAGLDSFAQRRRPRSRRIDVFEVDRPGPQAWKRRRLAELKLPVPRWLHFVPVDFEAGDDWLRKLESAGFDREKPAVVASTGVSMYLTREANAATLRQIARLARGTTLAMTFMQPMELLDAEEQRVLAAAKKGAGARGTPIRSFFAPGEMVAFARAAGLKDARCVSGAEMTQRYFAGRSDGLRPGGAEGMLVATVG